jgi:hypothetical protein
MDTIAWIFLIILVAGTLTMLRKFKSFGGGAGQVERRKIEYDPSPLTPERRKDDDVGGED